VSGGIVLRVIGPEGAGPGDRVTGAGDRAAFDVTVRAPTWVAVDRLEVFVDGALHESIAIRPEDAVDPATGLAATVEVPVAPAGSWVVFHASGDGDLAPVHRAARRPASATRCSWLAEHRKTKKTKRVPGHSSSSRRRWRSQRSSRWRRRPRR